MAVNYADAKKKALARDPKTAVCLDYGDAWFFAPKAGGIGDGMVVMKNNGEVKPMFMYAAMGTGSDKPKKLNFATGQAGTRTAAKKAVPKKKK